MPVVTSMQINWSGFVGAPGMTIWNLWDPNLQDQPLDSVALSAAATAARTFWASVAAEMPDAVTVSWPGSAEAYDVATGELVALTSYTPPGSVTGSQLVPYSAPSGAHVNWLTSSVVNGRLLRGRTFIVPLAGAYQDDGSLAADVRTVISNASAQWLADSEAAADWAFAVWRRPFAGTSDRPAYSGDIATVDASNVPDQATVLRSRRD